MCANSAKEVELLDDSGKEDRQLIERQELSCTECGRYVQFDMDFELDGNHEIMCPECGHIHYRVVENGKITETRWATSSLPSYTVSNVSTTSSSYTTLYTSAAGTGASYILADAWLTLTGSQ